MMEALSRIIKHGPQLNGFIMVFTRVWKVGELVMRGRGAVGTKIIPRFAVAIPRPRRRPPIKSGTEFLLSGIGISLFPVLHAWSPWKKQKNPEDEEVENRMLLVRRTSADSTLRLVDKLNKELREDIVAADQLFETGNTANYEKAAEILLQHLDKREPEVLWRLGRLTFEKSKIVETTEEKRALIEEAYDFVFKAMAIDEKNFAIHKWMAILINELSSYKGLKAQLLESVNVRKHMLRAIELNPDDATSIYLLGYWCYSVADIPWYQRKVAETLFAKPPECSFAEAYKHFLRAEYTQPGFYSMNLLMLAKCCIKAGDMDHAEQYLHQLKKFKVKTKDDFMAKDEGRQLRDKLFKASKYGKPSEDEADPQRI